MDQPFMEHPSGDFETAVEAMADAIRRARALPAKKRRLNFSAQGVGDSVDSYHFAEIVFDSDELKLQNPDGIETSLVTKAAGVPEPCLRKNDDGFSIADATPMQAARILDVIFRRYLGIAPHPDEGDDYAIGAEKIA